MNKLEYDVEFYITRRDRCPFRDWFHELPYKRAKEIVLVRIERIRTGKMGDCKTVGREFTN